MQIPEKLINFRCYGGVGSLEFLGLTDVELPKFDPLMETIKGAGIAGEYDSPVLGHFQQQSIKLKWRTVTAPALQLLAPIHHQLQIRGAVQLQDPMAGVLVTQALRVEVRGQQKGFNPGKVEPGKPFEAECEIECASIRVFIDEVPIVWIDKFNMKFEVMGVDYLQPVRIAMGGV